MTIPKHAMRCLECGVVIWHKDHAVGCRFYKPPVQRANDDDSCRNPNHGFFRDLPVCVPKTVN